MISGGLHHNLHHACSRQSRQTQEALATGEDSGSHSVHERQLATGRNSSRIGSLVIRHLESREGLQGIRFRPLAPKEYLRPTSGTTPRVEKRGNKPGVPRGRAPPTTNGKAAVDRYGCLGSYPGASISDWFEAHKTYRHLPVPSVQQMHRERRLDADDFTQRFYFLLSHQTELARLYAGF